MTPIVPANKSAPSSARSAAGCIRDGESPDDERAVSRYSFVTGQGAELAWLSLLASSGGIAFYVSFAESTIERGGVVDAVSRVGAFGSGRAIAHSACI